MDKTKEGITNCIIEDNEVQSSKQFLQIDKASHGALILFNDVQF